MYWGFVNYVLLILCFFILRDSCSNFSRKDEARALIVLTLGLSTLSHTVTIGVMRFRHAGKFCSGDYSDNIQTWTLLETEEPYLH